MNQNKVKTAAHFVNSQKGIGNLPTNDPTNPPLKFFCRTKKPLLSVVFFFLDYTPATKIHQTQ